MLGDQQYVLEWDDESDLVTTVGAVPGPAGSVELAMRGVTVEIDAADLRVVNTVTVADARELSRDARRHALLQRLLGERPAAEMISVIGASRRRRADVDAVRPHPLRGVRPPFAQLALLMSALDSPGLSTTERALARLEASTLIRDLKLGRDLDAGSADADEAAAVIVEQGDRLFDLLAPEARERAAEVLRAAPVEHARLRAELDRLIPSMERNVFYVDLDLVAGARHAAPAMAPALALVPDLPSVSASVASDSLPALLWDLEPSVRRTTGDEYEIRLGGCGDRTTGWWVRVFRPETDIPLAVVPMLDDRGDSVATLLLAHDDARDVELDIVDDPRSPRASTRLTAFRVAIAHGQRAARLDRLDRPSDAGNEWLRCGRAHREAGDDSRARQAEAIADQQRMSSARRQGARVPPVITDFVGPKTARW